MSARHFILGLAGVAALAIPYAASAQGYPQPGYGGQPNYGQPQGDYGRGYDRGDDHDGDWGWSRRFPGYPEFREREEHVERLIWRSVREDMITPDDGRELMEQMHRIQWQEQHLFQKFGWRLPDGARGRIGFELEQLDHQVDQMRQEP